MITSALILAFLESAPRHQATLKQLLRELNARGPERIRLRETLSTLVRERRLVERRHVYVLAPAAAAPQPHSTSAHSAGRPAPVPARSRPAAGDIIGRLSLHRDGYGFVTPDPAPARGAARTPGDIFIPPKAVHGAMHGDRVAVRLTPRRPGLRAPVDSGDRLSGSIAAIVERRHATLVGTFHCDPRGNYVQPFDDRIREPVRIPPGAETPPEEAGEAGAHRVLGKEAALRRRETRSAREMDGLVVEAEIRSFASATAAAQGRVLEILGQRGDFGVDVEIVIRKHHLRHRFPPEVLDEAAALAPGLPERALALRHDFRGLPIVTIDGESARDFDDAVYVAPLPGGAYELQVHIADVSAYVAPGSAIDAEARRRGTSVYFPDRAVPMLPLELSTGLCSLLPGEDRLTMSCRMEISPEGEVTSYELRPGVIRSAARMTYTQVNAVLEGDRSARERFAELAPRFELMAELQAVLQARRHRRGSIDFDLPEPEIAFDELGLMQSIVKSERNRAHRIIEEFMLAAAETVARHIEASGRASVYRIHEPPDWKKVAEFEEVAAAFGHTLGAGPLPIRKMRVRGRVVEVPQPGKFHISPRHYQQLTERIAGRPEERMLSYLMLRSLKQARYSAHNQGHFALAAACYTHFTSPIRRYPDLLVHRILKALLRAEPPEPELAEAATLEPLCQHASEAEREAEDAERELLEWKKVRYMEDRLGEVFPALIVHVTRHGFYVELTDLFIEGFVPAAALDGDEYRYQDAAHAWVGARSKRRFQLGGTIEVLVDRIDPVRQEIHFAPAGESAPPTAGRARGSKSRPPSARRRSRP